MPARRWTAEHLETLAHMRARGVSWGTCALVFGTTRKACEAALRTYAGPPAAQAAPPTRRCAPTSPTGGGGAEKRRTRQAEAGVDATPRSAVRAAREATAIADVIGSEAGDEPCPAAPRPPESDLQAEIARHIAEHGVTRCAPGCARGVVPGHLDRRTGLANDDVAVAEEA